MNSKKLLVIQSRTDVSLEHEQSIFRQDFSELGDRLEFCDAITQDFPEDLTQYFAVVFAGSAEFMLGRGDGVGSWREKIFAFIDKLLEANMPTLGICFGFQLISVSQGATIIDEKAMHEAGSYGAYLTEAGQRDLLFEECPKQFMVQLGHKETVVDFPEQFIGLGGTERVDCNMFRIKGKPVWGVLYHPELTVDRMRTRLSLFPEYADGVDLSVVFEHLEDAPESFAVLQRFVWHHEHASYEE